MTTDDPQKIKARLNDITDDVRDVYQDAACCINALQAENRELQAERDELVVQLAEMLEVQNEQQEPERKRPYEASFGTQAYHGAIYPDGEYVKNSDAVPIQKNANAGPTVKWSGERRGEPIKPEELQAGDVVDVWTNGTADYFTGVTFQELKFSSPAVSTLVFSDSQELQDIHPCDDVEIRLVHRPSAPVTAETIRQSEPGSTWGDKDGNIWEWDGYSMRSHGYKAIGSPTSVDAVVNICKPLTRSTAAPRGDYGEKELPTEVGSLILITDYRDEQLETPVIAVLEDDGDWVLADLDLDGGLIYSRNAHQITGWKPAKVVTDD